MESFQGGLEGNRLGGRSTPTHRGRRNNVQLGPAHEPPVALWRIDQRGVLRKQRASRRTAVWDQQLGGRLCLLWWRCRSVDREVTRRPMRRFKAKFFEGVGNIEAWRRPGVDLGIGIR